MSNEPEQPLDLIEITSTFGEAYFVVKDTDSIKKDYQKKFFEAATATLEQGTLARKTVVMPKGTVSVQGDWERWVQKYHPGWRFVSWVNDDGYTMIIEQDPALMKFTFLNPNDNRVYGRTTVDGGQFLDDERLREEDLDLWLAITKWDAPEWLPDLLYECNVDYEDIDKKIDQLGEDGKISRVLLPTDQLTSEQLEALQPYMVPGPISIKLVPPRAAREEELET